MGLLDCVDTKENIGVIACNKLPQMPKLIITTPAGFSLSPADAVDPTKWQAAIKLVKGARIYLFPEADNFEDKSEAAVYQSTPLSVIPVRDGRYQWMMQWAKSLCYHKAMYSHRGKGDRVFIVDVQNQIFGMLGSDGNFRGFTMAMFNTEKLQLSNGTNATMSPVYFVLADNKEVDQSGALIDGSFVSSLYALTDVDITVITQTDSSIVISVKTTCDGTPILGLVKADFILLKTDGTTQAILASTDNGDGTYSFTTATAFVDGSIDLVAPSALSLTVGAYESTGAQTVNVP